MNILERIIRIKQNKLDFDIEPSHVLDVELYNDVIDDVKSELNRLFREGEITVVQTLNNKAIDVKQSNTETS
jgi:hypothetical protein